MSASKHKAVVFALTILLILVVEIYITKLGWNAIEGWLAAGVVSAIVGLVDGVLTYGS
jgi:hypothetical protein